jgi:hypothetical protein
MDFTTDVSTEEMAELQMFYGSVVHRDIQIVERNG